MPNESTGALFDLQAWLDHHRLAAAIILFGCGWVSLTLIIHLWRTHHSASFLRKLIWSFILFVPGFGWMFYAGFFQVPERTDMPCMMDHGPES